MTIRGSISILLTVALTATSVPLAAKPKASPLSLRDLLEERRVTQVVVSLELSDQTVASGRIARITNDTFLLGVGVDQTTRTIPYRDVRVMTDQATGERFELQARPTGPAAGHTVSKRTWLWVVVVVGVVYLVGRLVIPID